MRLVALVLFLAAVGCKSTSAPYRDAVEANTSTAVALGSTGACLEVGAQQLTTLGQYVMEAGKGYYTSVVDLWEQARGYNARAEFANAVQKQKVDGLETARAGWQGQYDHLRGKWWVRAGLFIEKLIVWYLIIYFALRIGSLFIAGPFGAIAAKVATVLNPLDWMRAGHGLLWRKVFGPWHANKTKLAEGK